MSRESSLWSWLNKASKVWRDDLDMNRIENSVMSGMPDVEGFLRSHGQFWIELKSSERPARATTKIRFKVKGREAQAEWLEKRWLLGSMTWLCLQVGSGHKRRIYLVPGKYAARVYAGVTEEELQKLDVLQTPNIKPQDIVRIAASLF